MGRFKEVLMFSVSADLKAEGQRQQSPHSGCLCGLLVGFSIAAGVEREVGYFSGISINFEVYRLTKRLVE